MANGLAQSPDWLTAFNRSGRYVCPSCDPTRQPQHRGEKNLKVTVDDQGIVAFCHHCNQRFIHTWGYDNKNERRPERRDVEPIERFTTADKLNDHETLDDEALAYLAARGISKETAEVYGCFTGERFYRSRKDAPAGRSRGIGFPYLDDGKHYASKWRSFPTKNFSADGAAHTLFGPPTPAGQPLIICEGEIDAMSVREATGLIARSLPNGASDTGDQGDKLKFLDRNYDEIAAAERVILWTDNDKAGRMVADEMARRIGRDRVWRVVPRADRKDANEVLVQDGPDAVKDILSSVEPWPVEGLIRAMDAADAVRKLHRDGLPPGVGTGFPSVDKLMTLQEGMLYIGTGRPGGGKTTFIDNVMVDTAIRLHWAWGVASFESPTELEIARFGAIKHGTPFRDLDPKSVDDLLDWANGHFHFLTTDGLVDIDSLLERVSIAVTRYGIRGLVIDPFNYIRTKGQEMDTEGINVLLSRLKAFAMAKGILIILIAHPAKPPNDSEEWIPTGYSVSGSAHFYNRADFGFTLARAKGTEELEGDSIFVCWKAKWSHLGKEGRCMLDFDPSCERFMERRTPVYGDDDGPAKDPFKW